MFQPAELFPTRSERMPESLVTDLSEQALRLQRAPSGPSRGHRPSNGILSRLPLRTGRLAPSAAARQVRPRQVS